MSDRKRNRRYILFLLLLSGFGFLLYKNLPKESEVTGKVLAEEKLNVEESANVVMQSPCANEVEPQLIDDYVTLDLENPIDITEQVLGETSCESFSQQFNISRMCEDGSVTADVGDGGENNAGIIFANKGGGDVDRSTDAEIRLVEVTFPAQFWNGSKFVIDNTEQISKKDPVYNSSGDYLSLDYGSKFLTPGQADAFSSTGGYDREAFSVMAENKIALAEEIENQIGTYIVEKETNEPYISMCGKKIQPSAFNPTTANKSGEILANSMEIPGGDPDLDEKVTSCVETSDTITYTMSDSNMYDVVCSEDSLLARFVGHVRAFFSNDEWTKCSSTRTIQNEDGTSYSEDDVCKTKENIIVEMTSVYGAVEKCEDGVCANAGMTSRFLGSQTPAQADGYEIGSPSSDTSLTRAILTPCKVEIREKGAFFWEKSIVDVYCKWDATPNLANYRAQQVEKIPGDESYPADYDEYWNLVVQALERDSKLSNM